MRSRTYWWVAALALAGCASRPPPPDSMPKLFIAGDSTAATYTSTDKNQQG